MHAIWKIEPLRHIRSELPNMNGPERSAVALRLVAWRTKPSTADSPEWTATPEARRAFENTADYLTARGIA